MNRYQTTTLLRMNILRVRGQNGFASITSLFEVLLIGLVVWAALLAISTMQFSDNALTSADASRVVQPILQLTVTSNGQQLWSQLGTSEIVSVDLATRRTQSIYRRNSRVIGNWCVSQDGATFLLSNDGHDVQIIRDRELVVSEHLLAPTSPLIALSSNGQGAIRISGGTAARYWDLSSDEPLESDFELLESALKIALDSLGNKLAVWGSQGGLHIYELKTDVPVRRLAENTSLSNAPVFSTDGNWLAVVRGLAFTLFDVHSGEIAWTVHIPGPDPFFSVAFSPDGKWIAASGFTAGIQIFDRSNGELHRKLPSVSTVHRIAFSLTNDTLYSGCTDGSIRIWSLSDGQEVERLNLFGETRKNEK